MRKINLLFFRSFCVFITLLLTSTLVFAQKNVSGRVTDASGSGVAGITVTVKGSTNATQTSNDGTYSVLVPQGATTLVFTGVGYITQELPVSGGAVNARLETTATSLNEVVVIGYGTAKRKDLTGSTSLVTSKDFQKGQVTTAEQLIVGKVAGVSIVSNGGAPGAGSTIRIRGGASLAASNDPLIIVDGVQLGGGGIAGSANFLATLNPNEIESFTILKDASSAAIYGSRATNGVIIITTKKGKSGKMRINFNTALSLGTMARSADVLNPSEFRDFVKTYGNETQVKMLGVTSTIWQDEIYQNAFGADNNISLSGATKGSFKMPYRVSMGYLDQEGMLITGRIKRASAGLNLNPTFFDDHLKIDLAIKGTNTKSRFADEGTIGGAVRFDPTKPVRTGFNRFGGFYEYLDQNTSTGLKSQSPTNPIGILKSRFDESSVDRSVGNVQVDYKFHFLPELRVNANVGYDIAEGNGTVVVNDSVKSNYRRGIDENNVTKGGLNNFYKQKIQNTFLETYLNYTNEVASIKSKFDLTGGYGYYDYMYKNYSYADYFYDGTKRSQSDPLYAYDQPQNRLISFYGRLNYTLAGKYLLTANVRHDGSSKLNPDNRWLTYYSGALAWRVSEEAFLKNSDVVSDLKLRAGYGITGQQDGIGNYSYLARYTLSNQSASYLLGNTYYNMYRPEAYNPFLTWEQTATKNVAVDFGFLKNRLTGTIEVYEKETKDLLNNVGQAAGANFAPEVLANVGLMRNRGIEVTLNSQIVKKQDFSFDFGVNATYNENKITKLTFQSDDNYEGMRYGSRSGGTGGSILINTVGYGRGSFYVYKQVYDQSGNPIDNLFEDLNRDGAITEKDLYRYKSVNPDVFLGVYGNVTYKRLNVGFIGRAVLGNYVYNNVASGTGTLRNFFDPLGYLANGSRDVLNTKFSGNGDKYFSSDYYVQNASFFRMDNITLGYNVGKVFDNKADMRLNFNVQNVFVITKYNGVDPEISSGIDNNFYPRPRTFVLGANFDF